MPVEETGAKHEKIENLKKLTNFENTKETLKNINLELPKTVDIKDIKKFMLNRDEKIEKEIIKPRNALIQELFEDNVSLHKALSKQAVLVNEAEKYQKEKASIIADNESLNKKVANLEIEYQKKSKKLDLDFENRKSELETEYNNKFDEVENHFHSKIYKLEKEVTHLHSLLDKFKETLGKFIHWICRNFEMKNDEESLVREFEKDCDIFMEPEKQLEKEKREKEWDLER